jgi:glycosyltransferase involved in cell wall biosynthesis
VVQNAAFLDALAESGHFRPKELSHFDLLHDTVIRIGSLRTLESSPNYRRFSGFASGDRRYWVFDGWSDFSDASPVSDTLRGRHLYPARFLLCLSLLPLSVRDSLYWHLLWEVLGEGGFLFGVILILMRVLHVHSGNLYGGVETILTTLARRASSCPELQQEFALCFEGRLSRELAALGATTHGIGPVRVSRPLSVIRSQRQLRKLLISQSFEVLVFHSAWSHAIFAPVACTGRLPAVVWMHGTTGGHHWSERWSRRRRPSFVICNSRFTATGAAAVYPNSSRSVLYCPLELDSEKDISTERNAVRRELNTSEHAIVVVQAGRIERGKGQLLHLEAFSRLRGLSNWICWFAGGPQQPEERQYFDELRRAAVRLGIADRVRFLNERSDVPRLLNAADIYCQPNVEPESFGITLVEALNARLPVVTTRIGGAIEILDEQCGLFVRPHNASELAAALRCLIEDAGLRRQLSQNGPARARHLCDPLARFRDFCGILEHVVAGLSPLPGEQPSPGGVKSLMERNCRGAL